MDDGRLDTRRRRNSYFVPRITIIGVVIFRLRSISHSHSVLTTPACQDNYYRTMMIVVVDNIDRRNFVAVVGAAVVIFSDHGAVVPVPVFVVAVVAPVAAAVVLYYLNLNLNWLMVVPVRPPLFDSPVVAVADYLLKKKMILTTSMTYQHRHQHQS